MHQPRASFPPPTPATRPSDVRLLSPDGKVIVPLDVQYVGLDADEPLTADGYHCHVWAVRISKFWFHQIETGRVNLRAGVIPPYTSICLNAEESA